ncbi:hypothetical protein KQI84_13130 [bacterium]|nr:hypothetical protein [bacterium]
MKHDEKPEKPEAVSEEWKRKLRRSWTLSSWLALVLAVGLGVYFGLPHFFRARETSAKNWCQENQTKIDSAVQQYILEYNLADQEEFVELFGTELEDWAPVLVGPDLYIRFTPRCPNWKPDPWWKLWWKKKRPPNDYSIAPTNEGFVENGAPVRCNLCDHPYPQAIH